MLNIGPFQEPQYKVDPYFPKISYLNGRFDAASGRMQLVVGRIKGETIDGIEARAEKPQSLLDRASNFFGYRRWVPIYVNDGQKTKQYWVSVSDLSAKLKCTPESIRKAAKEAKITFGVVETWITVATAYQEMKVHFKGQLSSRQIRDICRKASILGETIAQAKVKDESDKGQDAIAALAADEKSVTALKEHRFSRLPVTILTSQEKLGAAFASGSYKAVYKANQVASKEMLVIAMAQTKINSDEARRTAERLTDKEAYLLILLKDAPGIIPIKHAMYYLNKEDNTIKTCLKFEYANEGDLWFHPIFNNKIDKNDKAVTLKKLGICEDVARGIKSCHDKGIVHADIKPDNVLIKKEETTGKLSAFIADFGLSFMRDTPMESLCRSEWSGGTMDYRSPEVWIYKHSNILIAGGGKKDLNKPIDLFSLGTMMYQLFYGDPPWVKIIREPSKPEIAAAVLECFRKELPELRAQLEKDLPIGPIIAGLLHPNPDNRITIERALKMIADAKVALEQEMQKKEVVK